MIFIDADAFIAIHVSQDLHHKKAISLKLKTNDELVTSTEIIFEVTAKLSFFTTHELACKFIKDILESSVAIEFIDFSRLSSAKELGIKKFCSFDSHHSQNGFELLK